MANVQTIDNTGVATDTGTHVRFADINFVECKDVDELCEWVNDINDSWNCSNCCGNDVNYVVPVVEGDVKYFQFEFPDDINIDPCNLIAGWDDGTTVQYIYDMCLYDCDGNLLSSDITAFASEWSVFLGNSTDSEEVGVVGNICIEMNTALKTLVNNQPFYFELKKYKDDGGGGVDLDFNLFSRYPYRFVNCEDTVLLEGCYDDGFDCGGNYYGGQFMDCFILSEDSNISYNPVGNLTSFSVREPRPSGLNTLQNGDPITLNGVDYTIDNIVISPTIFGFTVTGNAGLTTGDQPEMCYFPCNFLGNALVEYRNTTRIYGSLTPTGYNTVRNLVDNSLTDCSRTELLTLSTGTPLPPSLIKCLSDYLHCSEAVKVNGEPFISVGSFVNLIDFKQSNMWMFDLVFERTCDNDNC